MIRATFECESHDDLVKFARDILEEQGFEVRRPNLLHAKETPKAFCERIGISIQTFTRKIRLPNCPTNFEIDRGPKGRVVCLKASPELEEFMRSPIGGKTINGQS